MFMSLNSINLTVNSIFKGEYIFFFIRRKIIKHRSVSNMFVLGFLRLLLTSKTKLVYEFDIDAIKAAIAIVLIQVEN